MSGIKMFLSLCFFCFSSLRKYSTVLLIPINKGTCWKQNITTCNKVNTVFASLLREQSHFPQYSIFQMVSYRYNRVQKCKRFLVYVYTLCLSICHLLFIQMHKKCFLFSSWILILMVCLNLLKVFTILHRA